MPAQQNQFMHSRQNQFPNQGQFGIQNSERNQFTQEGTKEENPNNKGTVGVLNMKNNQPIIGNNQVGEQNEHKKILGKKN